jgi:hypothetical protein
MKKEPLQLSLKVNMRDANYRFTFKPSHDAEPLVVEIDRESLKFLGMMIGEIKGFMR